VSQKLCHSIFRHLIMQLSQTDNCNFWHITSWNF